MTNRRKSGLGKSLDRMFGEDKIKKDFERMEEIEENKYDQEKEIERTYDYVETPKRNEFYENETSSEITKINLNNDISNEKQLSNQNFINVKINLIQPNLSQPRKNFDEGKLQELAESIRKYGILQPLLVKQNGPLYEIIAGERRWRAANIAGLLEVPVQIKQFDKKTTTEVALIENIQREDLNAVEEALAYQQLIDEYGLSQEEVAQRVSKSRSTITNSLRILKLNQNILNLIKEGKLSAGHAKALLSIDDEELRDKISKRVIEENLNVRDIEKLVRLDNLANWRKENRTSKDSEKNIQELVIIKDLEKRLKNKLGTKVKILQKDENEGKIEIKYFGKEDLDRIINLLNSIREY